MLVLAFAIGLCLGGSLGILGAALLFATARAGTLPDATAAVACPAVPQDAAIRDGLRDT